MTTSTDYFEETRVAAASTERGEPSWLTSRRADAARAFAATPMPSPALRPWRYTDVAGLDFAAFAPVQPALSFEGAHALEDGGGFAGPLTEAVQLPALAEVLQVHLGSVVTATEGKFVAANAALWDNGALIHVPRGQAWAEPVVVSIDVGAAAGQASLFPRVLIVAEEQAEVTVVLRHASGETPLLVSDVIEVVAAQASKIRLLIDGRWGPNTQEFMTLRSRIGRDADVQVATIAIGGALVKETIEGLVEGEGANSIIRGVALGDEHQHFDFVTLQDHVGARSTSDVAIKSALAGSSRSIYYGVTRVEATAGGSAANQENRNLLLSDGAKADADPVLEILTADVIRCGHGATVGPVDAEALFYLQSRGLDRRTALQLLVFGFFQSVIKGIALTGIEDDLYEAVTSKLATAELQGYE